MRTIAADRRLVPTGTCLLLTQRVCNTSRLNAVGRCRQFRQMTVNLATYGYIFVVVLVAQQEAALAIVLAPVQLHEQRPLLVRQLPLLCNTACAINDTVT